MHHLQPLEHRLYCDSVNKLCIFKLFKIEDTMSESICQNYIGYWKNSNVPYDHKKINFWQNTKNQIQIWNSKIKFIYENEFKVRPGWY